MTPDPKQPMAQPRELLRNVIAAMGGIKYLRHITPELADEVDEALAGRAESASETPEGWQLVPKEATQEMMVAGMEAQHPNCGTGWWEQSIYQAMLAAAPIPPQTMAAQPAADADPLPYYRGLVGWRAKIDTMLTEVLYQKEWVKDEFPHSRARLMEAIELLATTQTAAPVAQADAQDAARPVRDAETERRALEHFTEYFVRNYPGPNTIISRPTWHAPKVFRAALYAIDAAIAAQADGGGK